ncbi:MAG: EAL domain-containing protein [Treponema sp.]|uniref:EAL domain-containing protein n=1 Tax=Treponema sp. TaxID=166 RepID=UPI0025DE744B|nr:GGDEF domain-containing phosphodiesterase [Treponema sp.]MBQ8679203.1 EAL domain-containing protein [Treponema sp.]
MSLLKSMYKKVVRLIKKLLGLQGYSDYFKHYFDIDNAHSGVVISVITMMLEIYMMGYVLFHVFTGSKSRSILWIAQHLSSYILLFSSAFILFKFSRDYINGKRLSRIWGKIIRTSFALICLCFGIYISYLDYLKGEQILTLITMEIFVFGILLWRPATSITLITSSLLAFYFLVSSKSPASYATRMNLFTTWLSISVTTIVRFQQKFLEAKKAEHIENVNTYLGEVAVTDEATGIGNMVSFRNRVGEIRSESPEDFLSRIFLFLDVRNFSSYNERHGFDKGSQLLNSIAHTIKYTFGDNPVARFSDDHFVVFAKREGEGESAGFQEKLDSIRKKISVIDPDVKLGLKVGSYIPEDIACHTNTACDFARYACDSIKKKYDIDYCEYTTASAEDFARRQYVINNIDKAIENDYIQVYYQPVVLSKNKELCGFEALARWIDPKYGFMPPYSFIPVLEEYRQIYKLDAYILKKVCQDILEAPAKGVPVFPISINFSRIDFELMDVEQLLEDCVEKQNIDKNLIHVEVTESALSQSDKHLQETLRILKSKKYSLWLDDFGSGYSGLNILKEYEFDMMKIDMAFLRNFSNTPKSRPILKNIVTLANDIGMQTLSEGVETEDAFEFLRSIGCERIQGYLFGKPMPKDEIIAKIKTGEFLITKEKGAE